MWNSEDQQHSEVAMDNAEAYISEYLQQHDSIQYYLSPDETVIHAIDNATKTVLFAYMLEESWSPSENDSAEEV